MKYADVSSITAGISTYPSQIAYIGVPAWYAAQIWAFVLSALSTPALSVMLITSALAPAALMVSVEPLCPMSTFSPATMFRTLTPLTVAAAPGRPSSPLGPLMFAPGTASMPSLLGVQLRFPALSTPGV